MTIRVIRAGEHVQHIPGWGMTVRESGVAVVSNWWEVAGKTCVAAYQPKGAASYAASKVNLANPGTYDATEGNAPTWDAGTGWRGAYYSTWLKTGIVPSDATWTAICRFQDVTGGDCYVFGNRLPGGIGIGPRRTSDRVWYWHGASPLGVLPEVSTGILAIANRTAYRNGIAEPGVLPAATGLAGQVMLLAFSSSTDTGRAGMNGYFQAFAIYDSELSAAQIATLTARMAAL